MIDHISSVKSMLLFCTNVYVRLRFFFLALRNTGQRDAHHVLVVGGAVFYGWHMECLLKEFSNDFICQSTHVVSAFRFRCEFKNRFMFGLCLFEGFA